MIKSFDEVFEDVTKLGVKIKTDEYHPIGKYQIIDQGQEAVAGYSDLEDGVFENVPAIVFGDHTRIVKYVDQPFFLGADGVKVLRSRFKDANYRYLYYALKSVKIPNTGYNRHFKWLKEAKIYYPNSEEQSKIVLILDEISSVIEHRQRQLQKLDELVKARFIELFGDCVLNSKGWKTKRLGDIAEVGSSKRVFVEDLKESGIPFYRGTEIGALAEGKTVTPELFISKEHYAELCIATGAPNIGDLLMPSICPDGRIWVVNTEKPFYFKDGRVLWVHAIDDSYNPVFLLYTLKDRIMSDYSSIASGTTFAELKIFALKECHVFDVPLELQNQFAAFVNQTDKSKVAVQKALDEAQLLFDSLMQKYFG